MDSILQTSLEALLLKATSAKMSNVDNAAVDAFCTLVNKEKDGAHIGVKVIATRLPSSDEKETLQTLNILDTCMNRCGTLFQNEVGKFRFLNEMIKLVSPKYLGSHTPTLVKQKVLQLLYLWTLDYPKETKIKEAYDMLRKQGVIRDMPNCNVIVPKRKHAESVFQDEEKSKILQKLLQSKDPEDIQAANWLIKSMVKEDDKRAEITSIRTSELESVQNNMRLLNEMLDSYQSGVSSGEELDLIKELYESCERLRPNLLKLAAETQMTDDLLNDVLQTSDELSHIFAKYNGVILGKKSVVKASDSLLDFDCLDLGASSNQTIDILSEMFNATNIETDVLQPVLLKSSDKVEKECDKNIPVKTSSALEELDMLSEHLIKENLSVAKHCKNNDKMPMKSMTQIQTDGFNITATKSNDMDLSCLIDDNNGITHDNNADDSLVDITEELSNGHSMTMKKTDMKLNDIYIKMEDVKPSTKLPIAIIDDRNGLTVTLHFTKEKPRDDVSVFVLTVSSKQEQPLTNYLFQAVVPKGCKLKLQPPSRTDLPAFNPFLPPAVITQIMLVASQSELDISLKCIVSFVIDEETYTEMGEIETLPLV